MAVVAVIASLVLAQIIYLSLWRLFFSPISHIPGPRLAALTSWYEFYYDVIKPGQFVWHIRDLHEKYGPIVRVTPWEIHIKDVTFLDEIYAPASRNREKYAFQTRTLKVPLSIGGTIPNDLHRRRREALNPFFNKKSVSDFESVLKEKVEKLVEVIAAHESTQMPVNLLDVYFAFANDVVSFYSFGHDNNLLGNEEKASTQRNNISRLLMGVKVNQHFPWLFDLMDMIPFPIAKHIMPPGALDMVAFTDVIREEVDQVLRDTDNILKGEKRSIFYELRDNPSLPPAEKSALRLEHEATLIVMAGTESTAKSIAIAHFHLLNNPQCMAKLRAELDTVPESASWSQLEQLPYLSGCIAEGNRLSFGVTARVCRIAPDETLQYKQYAIPPGTPVSQTSLVVHTDEKIFPDPWTFKPERWMGSEGLERKKYQMAFNKGARNCIGINLAHAEMFLALAAVARYDMTLHETDIRDVQFTYDFHVAYPGRLDSKGVQAKVHGKKSKL
ncbi:hypothetical protein DSL72_001673 [Monilinia vaccinii-corymbosi]|uniref:Cytochrome P450 n=1 Tax=Monilinia vaccinii-corymbosi TaxID=61207 RepID=A0A8A3P6B2_9HELO|nr:hypothetical protein DSL72_001673 [Monilinia vaccinii-corymbosi]